MRGVVLAAGRSSRMGEPKALVEWRGKSFIEHVLSAMAEGGIDEICVVTGGPHAEAIIAAVVSLPVSVPLILACNSNVESGPIGSVRIGADQWAPPAAPILVHPVDIPTVRADDVRRMILEAERQPAADAVIASVDHRRAHPVVLAPSLLARVAACPAELTLRDILRDPATRVAYAVLDNRPLLRDIDTPDDAAWLSRQRPSEEGDTRRS